jgi:hypothetical protein
VKVLAKIGLIIAAAATVLLIFVFEVYKPNQVRNQTMATAPEEAIESVPQSLMEMPQQSQELESESTPDLPEEVLEEPVASNTGSIDETPVVTEAVVEDVAEPAVDTRRIYGKITLASTGENLSGVNIMIPGSNVAKISNNIGGYTIEVPRGTSELIFIYRGKKLIKRISGSNTLLNVRLDLEAMEYD